MQTVSLSLFRFDSLSARTWALAMMALARLPLSRMPGLEFWKLCGAGTGAGFTPWPDPGVCALLCVWPDAETARRQAETAPLFTRYRRHAAEHWTIYLSPLSSRGAWSGRAPFRPEAEAAGPGIAALTRATIRAPVLRQFWRREPDVSRMIGANRDVLFKIGLGELPLLHQITFSVWPDTAAMAAFARASGPHARAIRAVREGGWFREELYARFRILGDSGSWQGQSPLAALEETP